MLLGRAVALHQPRALASWKHKAARVYADKWISQRSVTDYRACRSDGFAETSGRSAASIDRRITQMLPDMALYKASA